MIRRKKPWVTRFAEGGSVEEKDDLPMGVTDESVARNVGMTSSWAKDLADVREVARSNRAYLIDLYNRGQLSREELEDEFRRPLLGSTVPPSMLRQAMKASPEDVSERLRGAQRVSENSPSVVHQAVAAGLTLADDPEKAGEYARNAVEREVGKRVPAAVQELRRKGFKYLDELVQARQNSRPGYAKGGLVGPRSRKGDGCCTRGFTRGKVY